MNSLEHNLKATHTAYILYMVYMVSFFLHIPARIPVLGVLRIDLLLVFVIFTLVLKIKLAKEPNSKISTYILVLFVYAFLAVPFATWPGTVIGRGLPNLIKAGIFFFFTYKIILNEQRLKTMVYLFVFLNTFRVCEALFLNVVFGYWGEKTYYDGVFVQRLAGAPYDIIGANGLAFVIATILPFYHYLFGSKGFFGKAFYLAMLPICLYSMQLTLSRTGILAVIIIYSVIFLKSKSKALFIVVGCLGFVGFMASLDEVQRDRYLSIYSSDAKSSGSAKGRFEGLERDISVGMVKPILGHGLGTSKEANWNIGGHAQPSHNLWVETFQELGVIGLIIFILYAKEILKGFTQTNKLMKEGEISPFLSACQPAMQTWLAMNFLFSFASYGLTSYEWYLFGGFSAVLARLALSSKASLAKFN
jgi:putative inorganic carbon (hco3(-)) transporter